MDASISGYCDREMKNHVINDNVQSITLTWSPDSDNRGVKKHSLTFTFQRRGNDDFLEPFYQLVIIHGIFQTNDIEFPDAFNPGTYIFRNAYILILYRKILKKLFLFQIKFMR